MANLKLSHIYKVYENGHKAVNDFNIDIQDKEFIVFVGPSGCGKSTTLRMIAGLENITSGDLFIGDTLANDLEPKDRDIAMVFQSYALYPHMTVYDNMAFGLRNRHMPEDQIKEKVLEAAKMLDIEMYLDRKPKAMSGGQRQRVALGRALVRDPKVFLLDEPLSNLDAKLRAQMRTEITKLHKKLGTTFIYVTHDQVEAMTMGTRIVVMKLGYVQQIDTPMNLYNKPYNKFVAGFIGTPQMNFFNVKLARKGEKVEITYPDGSVSLVDYEAVSKIHNSYLNGETEVILGIRPEHITISEKKTNLMATVTAVEHLGNECIVYGVLGKAGDEFTMKDEGKNIIVKTIEGVKVEVGDEIFLEIQQDKLHLFDKETEITLLNPIPNFSIFEGKVASGKLDIFGSKVELPAALQEAIGDAKAVELEIPPFAVVPGKDFTLKVHQVEEVEGKKLAYLENGDRYLFALVDDKVKAGDKYSFSLRNDKLLIKVNGETVLEPIGEQEHIVGSFKKHDIGRNAIEFFYHVEGDDIPAPLESGYKINAVEGNNCYKKNYRYVFDRKTITLGEAGLLAKVEKILDYGNQKYAKLLIGQQELLAEVPADFAAEETHVFLNGEAFEVWQQEIDFRIC
jgi:multiple sugar transport system ATP-binding protein